MITREDLEGLFDDVRKNGSCDLQERCLWSYFFTDPDRDKLTRAGGLLERDGFVTIGLLEPTDDDDDQQTIFLQVDRIECHSVDSLLELNQRLYAFASEQGLNSYDGMEVGRVPDVEH